MPYRFKTKPFQHQRDEFNAHRTDEYRGLFWEQGTGKTKPIIDSVAALYMDHEIDGLCVIAPNGVHRNWVSDEIPLHMPDKVAKQTRSHIWYSTNAKYHKRSFEETLNHKGLAVLVMSYPAVLTDRGRDAWKAFLKQRKCMYVLDESQRVKNPGAKWSKRILGSHTASSYRRCLTGTPVSNSPFDLYNQLRFLQPDIWRPLGISTFSAFKQYFGVWETWQTKGGKTFPKCLAYRNLETLNRILYELGSRVTKDEVLDLPEKLYSKRYVELSPQQKQCYAQLKEDLIIELATGIVSVPLALVRYLRFQQIVCGYLPKSDDDITLQEIPGGNPRLDLLIETCEDIDHQTTIWARFTRDVQLISRHKFMKDKCIVVDGSVTGPARGEALDVFKRGDKQFLIANVQTDGVRSGQTLLARTVIYYSNDFSLEHRQQSEDRAHRIGQKHPVHYIDIVAAGTVDMHIIESLRKKVDVASTITGDNIVEWI